MGARIAWQQVTGLDRQEKFKEMKESLKKNLMAFYTKLTKQEIETLAGQYEIEVFSYEPIEQGVGNSNYLLATQQGQYVLTVFEIKEPQVMKMVEVLLLLEKNDIPAPRFERLKAGGVITEFKGKPVSLKPYIQGQVLEVLQIKQVNQVGTALAKLHEIPAPKNLSNQHTYVKTTYPQVLKQKINLNYRNWVHVRNNAILESIPSDLPLGIVHGDIFTDNLLFAEGEFESIIDFEDVSQIPRVFDVGMAIVGICTNGIEIDLRKAKALVDGYQEIRSFEENEKESLKIFIEWAAILTSTWRFWKYNIDTPDTGDAQQYVQMVGIAKNANAISRGTFYKAMFG